MNSDTISALYELKIISNHHVPKIWDWREKKLTALGRFGEELFPLFGFGQKFRVFVLLAVLRLDFHILFFSSNSFSKLLITPKFLSLILLVVLQ